MGTYIIFGVIAILATVAWLLIDVEDFNKATFDS